MANERGIRSGCFSLVITEGGAQVRLNQYTQNDDGDIFLTPVCVVYSELEYQIGEMVAALSGILDELHRQGRTGMLSGR